MEHEGGVNVAEQGQIEQAISRGEKEDMEDEPRCTVAVDSSTGNEAPMDHQQRHSKRLSLKFPILVPSTRRSDDDTDLDLAASPMTLTSASSIPSSYTQTNDQSAPSSTTFATPLTPPSEVLEELENLSTVRKATSPDRMQRNSRKHARSHTMANINYNYSAVSTPRSASPAETTTAASDFLTMLASQERRVLELKEELHRAESELASMKKHWAMHEANRKKGELRNGGLVNMDVLRSPVQNDAERLRRTKSLKSHARSATLATSGGLGLGLDIDEESVVSSDTLGDSDVGTDREKKRSLFKERVRQRGSTLDDGQSHSSSMIGGRRTGQRVFSSSRHTRALSLLATSSSRMNGDNASASAMSKQGIEEDRAAAAATSSGGSTSDDRIDNMGILESQSTNSPLLSRTPSGLARELNFGKTYKDLASAASRRSIMVPQGADVLMKHGRVVVDGVRDGLWNFFEDIRQATVGDEAARQIGDSRTENAQSIRKKQSGGLKSTSKARTGADVESRNASEPGDNEQSFWSEFGVDTPRAIRKKGRGTATSKPNTISSEPAPASSVETTVKCAKHSSRSHPVRSSTATTPHSKDEQAHRSKKEHHTSHSSTDSGDSRDSRNPPSLLPDSPTGSAGTAETTEREGETEVWDDWREVDSPSANRKPVSVNSNSERNIDGEIDFNWHDLTR